MPYRPMGQSGGGGGPIPEKTQGWLWGFLVGAVTALILDYLLGWWLIHFTIPAGF